MSHQQFFAAVVTATGRRVRTPKKIKKTHKRKPPRLLKHFGWALFTVAAIVWLWNKHPEPIILATLERWFSWAKFGEDA